jgi:hypothetical protein
MAAFVRLEYGLFSLVRDSRSVAHDGDRHHVCTPFDIHGDVVASSEAG